MNELILEHVMSKAKCVVDTNNGKSQRQMVIKSGCVYMFRHAGSLRAGCRRTNR